MFEGKGRKRRGPAGGMKVKTERGKSVQKSMLSIGYLSCDLSLLFTKFDRFSNEWI